MGLDDAEWIQIGPYRMTPEQVRKLLGEDGSSWNPWLLHEAAASVALDHDSRARTVSLKDLSPEDQERQSRPSNERDDTD